MMDQNIVNYIVIDDDPINNLICTKIIKLTVSDASVRTFTDPEKGLEHIISTYSVTDAPKTTLFLDINMPTMTGWEVLERFKELPDTITSKINIYILSSSVDLQDREKAEQDPHVADYIIKPLTQLKLQDIAQNKYTI